MSSFDCVILANGTFPTHPVPLAVLQEAKRIVACDGAIDRLATHLKGLNGTPLQPSAEGDLCSDGGDLQSPTPAKWDLCSVGGDLQSPTLPLTIVGDGDSVPAEYRHLLIKVDEQEDNDLTKATRYCIGTSSPIPRCRDFIIPDSSSRPSIAYLGCTGGREDHTLGNISLLMRYYREMGVEGRMFTDEGIFTPAHGDRTFSSFPGQQVSIFNFGCTRIASNGLKWDSYAYQEWWQGTLNEAVGNSFTLSADGYYLVFQTYGPKSH